MSAFLFHISYVLAQDFIRSGCTVNDTVPHVSNTTYKTLNASGSIVSPEISLTGSLSSWTWYTGVQALFNNSRVFQPIWVDTKGTDLAETNLGFEMCYLAFTGYTSDVQKRGQGDTGDCKKMLSQECIDDWKKSLTSQRNSARWNTSLATPCAQIGNTPDSCKETGGSLMQYGRKFSAPSFHKLHTLRYSLSYTKVQQELPTWSWWPRLWLGHCSDWYQWWWK